MLFSDFSKYLSKIEKTASRNEMTVILADLFKKLRADEIDKAVYLLQGKVSPQYEPEKFNLAEKTVIKAISFAFNKTAAQVMKIFKEKGDLGETVSTLAGSRGKPLQINDVYEKLYELTQISGAGTIDNKIRLISSLIKNLDAQAAKYILRMILDKMRLGFSDATVLDAFSWMLKGDKSQKSEIEKKYNIHPDLGLIGKILKAKGVGGLKHFDVEPGSPILMAKCERVGRAAEILEHGKKFGVEDKYDGFRLQIHIHRQETRNKEQEARNTKELFEEEDKQKKRVVIYSRNLENVTAMYPDVVISALKLFKNVNSLIIEGEAVGFNPITGAILPFQETVQRKRKYGIEKMSKDVPLKLIIFEVLSVNDKSLIEEPFEKRRRTLESMVGNAYMRSLRKNIVLSEVVWATAPEEIEKKFKAATAENMEGVVAKKADGIYQAGARGWNWIKLKRGFQGQKLTDTIDCVVMGYDVGQGKRNKFGIGDFLIGVYNKSSQKYETVAKIGTGLTDEEWRQIRRDIDKVKTKEKPKNYEIKKEMNCDVWATPRLVVEIMADEVTKSPIHTAGKGLALRFPRLTRFRPDKKAIDVTTTKELEKMFKKQ